MGKKPSTTALVQPDEIQNLVHVVRGQRVMLDSDLARLYGVTTMRLNDQVARNRQRFPEDFAYQFTQGIPLRQRRPGSAERTAPRPRGSTRRTLTCPGFSSKETA
jgi:hypothetical protein